jgi:LmbE family N-acetylglucosaminyl deacetylase
VNSTISTAPTARPNKSLAQQWEEFSTSLTTWSPPTRRTVIIAPHPDDEVLGAGGLIARQIERGIEVVIVAVTDGERAYSLRADKALGQLRSFEQCEAAHRLGVLPTNIIRLGLPDGHVERHRRSLEKSLTSILLPGDLVVAPWSHDRHIDHESVGRAANQVTDERKIARVSWIFWARQQSPPDGKRVRFVRMELDELAVLKRRQAIRAHRSQLEVSAPTLPAALLWPLDQSFEVFAIRPSRR